MNQRITRFVLATALIACTSLAQAQWMWVNEKGVKQFSDQPPPPGTPSKRILKAPRGQVIPDAQSDAPAASGDDAAQAEGKAPQKATLAERNADYNKRQKDSAEKTAKADEEAKREKEKAKYCSEAKTNIGMLESGMRVSEMGANGERGFMSDEGRSRKLQESRDAYNKTCK
ncbi:DUF4124 domain-containing protein [Pseudoduganella violaceinigra]|uniref:DUF4124 domain-containing protein n=1 Tax=Pseudoduganella violaceinigra TaxID=246602 RepID=UPI000429963C|nr:DUF4124 domain-containing protein [Pseudoduganella violaceinigra]